MSTRGQQQGQSSGQGSLHKPEPISRWSFSVSHSLPTMAIIFDIGIRKHLTIAVGCLSCHVLWGPLMGNPLPSMEGRGMSKYGPLSTAQGPLACQTRLPSWLCGRGMTSHGKRSRWVARKSPHTHLSVMLRADRRQTAG